MAGIFPTGGTDARNTQNAELDVRVVELCAALFYRLGCNPRFDPLSTNAIISEIANVVNDLGLNYDCNRLDNMSQAIQRAILTKNLPLLDPDMDDTIRGSYDGIEGQAFIKRILELGPAGLDQVNTLADQDSVYVGVGGVGRRIPFAQLKALVQPEAQNPGVVGAFWAIGNLITPTFNDLRGTDITAGTSKAIMIYVARPGDEGASSFLEINGVIVHAILDFNEAGNRASGYSVFCIKDVDGNWWAEKNAFQYSRPDVINFNGRTSDDGIRGFVSVGGQDGVLRVSGRITLACQMNPIRI